MLGGTPSAQNTPGARQRSVNTMTTAVSVPKVRIESRPDDEQLLVSDNGHFRDPLPPTAAAHVSPSRNQSQNRVSHRRMVSPEGVRHAL